MRRRKACVRVSTALAGMGSTFHLKIFGLIRGVQRRMAVALLVDFVFIPTPHAAA